MRIEFENRLQKESIEIPMQILSKKNSAPIAIQCKRECSSKGLSCIRLPPLEGSDGIRSPSKVVNETKGDLLHVRRFCELKKDDQGSSSYGEYITTHFMVFKVLLISTMKMKINLYRRNMWSS
ncbi:hypothetical protein GBA52_006601 [Prunus armeniaca]|nr:hypothetical protein GBA52_006601 [Prunus armeniaca]